MYKYVLILITIFFFTTASDIQKSSRLIWDDVRLDLREEFQLENHHLILADSSGDVVCFWEEKKSSDQKCLKALRFSSSFVPRDSIKEIVQFPDDGSFVKVYGSGNGNYVVLLAEKHGSSLVIKAVRLLSNLSYRESNFISICSTKDLESRLFGSIDNNDMVIIALHEDNKEDEWDFLTNLRLFYLNRNGLADSINVSTDEDVERYLSGCVPSEGSKVTLFFYTCQVATINKQMIHTRLLSYSSNSLELITGYKKILESESDVGTVDVSSTGRFDYPGCIAIGYGVNIPQARLLYLDSLCNIVEPFTSQLPDYLYEFYIGSGFNGAYGYIGLSNKDSMWVYFTDNKNRVIPPPHSGTPFFIKGTPGGICIDKENRPIISLIKGRSLYAGRIENGNLNQLRLNGIEDKPLLSKCTISRGGKNRVAGWRLNGVDSIYMCGWIGKGVDAGDETREWFTKVKSDSGIFSLKLSGDTAIMVYNLSNNLKIQLWNIKNKNSINLTNVNDNGAIATKPAIAISDNKIAVLWEDRREIHGDTPYVYLQFFDRGGMPLGSNIALSPGQNPSIQLLDNRYIITFHYSTQTTTNVGGIPVTKTVSYVYAMIVNENGSINLEPVRLNSESSGGSKALVSPFFNSDKQLVIWLESNVNMTSRRLYGCILDTTGRIKKTVFPITIDSSITDFDACTIDDYGVLLSWHDQQNGRIKALLLNSDGNIVVAQWTVSNRVIEADIPVSLSVSASDSACLISWIDGSLAGKSYSRVVGEYFVFYSDYSTKSVSPSEKRRLSTVAKINSTLNGNMYTLSGRKISNVSYVKNKTTGIYLEQMTDGKLKIQFKLREKKEHLSK